MNDSHHSGSTSPKRIEDLRFLVGKGRYVEDSTPKDVAYLGILRSPYAHAKIKKIDFSKVQKSEDFIASLTGSDLIGLVNPLFETPGQRTTGRYQLASDKVRFVGEGVAAIIARQRYAVEDLLEAIDAEYETLPPVTSIEDAKRKDILVYNEWRDNLALSKEVKRGNASAAIETAQYVTKTRVGIKRQAGIPIEPRSLIVSYDREQDKYTVYACVQSVHKFQNYLSKELGVAPEKLHYVVQDVGGGFGTKGAQSYPEFALAAIFAKRTGLRIKWTSTRTEDLLESASDRDQYCEIEIACDKDARMIALRAKIESDVGVMGTFNISLPHTIMLLPGCYKIPNIEIEGKCYVTNKCPAGPVRGAGRPDAGYFIETAVDVMARKLHLDPLEFRRRNVILPEEFPYDNGAGCIYDSGNYPLLIDTLIKATDYAASSDQILTMKRPKNGKDLKRELVGRGVSLVIEDTGAQMFENANIVASRDGQVTVVTGSSPHGQGLETTLAQLCSKELGVPIANVRVLWGDTELITEGLGTFASRSISVGGSAVLKACRDLEEILVSKASMLLGRPISELKYKNAGIVDGLDGEMLMRFEELLSKTGDVSVSSKYTLTAIPFASGAHYCELRIDRETGTVRIDRIVVVDDCGKVINQIIVDGQIHGGVAHGIGGALYEEILYNEDGQPLTSNLLDYTIPTAQTIPDVEVVHIETLSPVTLSGAKGVGESGTIGAYPAVFNALNNALVQYGVELHIAPASPQSVLLTLESRNK